MDGSVHTSQVISTIVDRWTLNSVVLYNLVLFPSIQFKIKNRKMVGNYLSVVLS